MFECDPLEPNSGYFPGALNSFTKIHQIPFRCTFELTPRCNLNCKMCYVHLTEAQIKSIGRELTNEEWLRIARQARDAGTLYLTLTGGEIFTRPHFRELYEELTEMGFLLTIMSNGTLIDESVISWLKDRPPYAISLTMYGSSNDIYKSVCNVKSGFDKFDHGLTLLQQLNIPIDLKATLIRSNEHDYAEMLKYVRSKGLHLRHTYGVVKPVRGATADAVSERKRVSDMTVSSYSRRDLRRYAEGHGPYHHHPNYLDDCGGYGNSATVTWNGHMIFCTFMSEPYINLIETSFTEAWTNLMTIINSIKRPEKCRDCKYEDYCTRCPGALAAETGSYNTVTDDFCKDAIHLYNIYNNL